MDRISLIIVLIAALPTMVFAGQGTIRETASQIIVEYEGDTNEVTAAKIVKDREDRLVEQEEKDKAIEAARIQRMAENNARHVEKRRAKENE